MEVTAKLDDVQIMKLLSHALGHHAFVLHHTSDSAGNAALELHLTTTTKHLAKVERLLAKLAEVE